MASYLKLEDNEGLKARIDEKASDIFKARKGKPQLQVNKCYKKKTDEGKETMCIERDQDVRNMFELKGLRHVRELVLSNPRYSRVIYNCVVAMVILPMWRYHTLITNELLGWLCCDRVVTTAFIVTLAVCHCVVGIVLVVIITLLVMIELHSSILFH
jgi:hypothetical protein